MRTIFIFLFLFSIVFQTSNAQTKIGLKAGYQFVTQVSGSKSLKPTNATAPIIGLIINHGISDNLDIQGELFYTSYKINVEYDQSGSGWFDLSYMEIPVFIRYYLVKGLNINAGIKPGFLLSGEAILYNPLTNLEKSDFSSMSLMFPVGVGYRFNFNLLVDARYNFGLSNIGNADKASVIKNFSALEISIGYLF